MTTMRAQRRDDATPTVEVTDVPVPEPGPGEVLVEVAFCGIRRLKEGNGNPVVILVQR